jgi:hypothetical protein
VLDFEITEEIQEMVNEHIENSRIRLIMYKAMLYYLPISNYIDEDHDAYLQGLIKDVNNALKNNLYYLAFFPIHLTFMTFINYTAWKLNKFMPNRFKDAIIGLTPSRDDEAKIFLEFETDPYVFYIINERTLMQLFKLLNMTKEEIKPLKGLVDSRNDYAHANGERKILLEEHLYNIVESYIPQMDIVFEKYKAYLKQVLDLFLIELKESEIDEAEEVKAYFNDNFIIKYELSAKDLEEIAELLKGKKKTQKIIYKYILEILDSFKSDNE